MLVEESNGLGVVINPCVLLSTNRVDCGLFFVLSVLHLYSPEKANSLTPSLLQVATFTVRLTTVPTAEVTVPVSSLDVSEGVVSPASLVGGTKSMFSFSFQATFIFLVINTDSFILCLL